MRTRCFRRGNCSAGGWRFTKRPRLDVLPAPTPLSEVKVEENERSALVDVYMPSIRMANVNRSVNRTVTLPAWLNAAALEKNVNFSQILQDALKEKLGVQTPLVGP